MTSPACSVAECSPITRRGGLTEKKKTTNPLQYGALLGSSALVGVNGCSCSNTRLSDPYINMQNGAEPQGGTHRFSTGLFLRSPARPSLACQHHCQLSTRCTNCFSPVTNEPSSMARQCFHNTGLLQPEIHSELWDGEQLTHTHTQACD